MTSTVQIALGGNLGDVPATFHAALQSLDGSGVRVTAVSRLYETPPMGHAAGGTFLNAAATLETTLEPETLLERLLETENALGRERDVHWGPRPVDLDLVLWEDRVIESPRLRVPHPGLWHRRFVLDPLLDVAAEAIHPETGEPIRRLRDRLTVRPLPVAVAGDGEPVDQLRDWLRRTFPAVISVADGNRGQASFPHCRGDEDTADREMRPDPCFLPALKFDFDVSGTSAATRTIGVSPDDENFAGPQAVLTAALGEVNVKG